jgi:hypothetical protein
VTGGPGVPVVFLVQYTRSSQLISQVQNIELAFPGPQPQA